MTDALRTRLKIGAGLLAFFTVNGLLMFGYMYFDDLTRANDVPLMEPLIEEMTGAYGAVVIVAILIWGTRRFRLRADNWQTRVPIYVLAMMGFSAVHTSLNALGRHLLFPLAGLGRYDYGIMALRFPMELFNDVLNFWVYVALLHLFYHYRESRDREVKTAKLEAELTRAQLTNLRTQLQPHFLFNTLNTISSHMYRDPNKADSMMTQLSDLLRATLASSTRQEVMLQDELDILRLYLEMMKSRFEDRLEVNVEIQPGCEAATVPSMILQPLAENAIRHGAGQLAANGRIDVHVTQEGETLLIQVRDNGPGIAGDPGDVLQNGLGLKNTVERLRRLYGDAQSLELSNVPGGGFQVSVRIPYRVSQDAEETANV